jgi:hypothetical protein
MPLVPHTPTAEAEAHASQIVALDAGDLAGGDLEQAEALLVACAGCAALRDDLAAIRGAMTSLPVPVRRRDFRLTDADAARLRPSGWRRLVGWLAAPGSAVRPLATGLATLGVVGLLLTASLPGLGGSAALLTTVGGSVDGTAERALGTDEDAVRVDNLQSVGPDGSTNAPVEAPVPGMAGEASPGTEASPAAAEGREDAPAAEPYALEAGPGDAIDGAAPSAEPGPSAPFVLSLVLLAAGLGLLLARAIALRRTA